jgi:uncharacterized Tic20 family protein
VETVLTIALVIGVIVITIASVPWAKRYQDLYGQRPPVLLWPLHRVSDPQLDRQRKLILAGMIALIVLAPIVLSVTRS